MQSYTSMRGGLNREGGFLERGLNRAFMVVQSSSCHVHFYSHCYLQPIQAIALTNRFNLYSHSEERCKATHSLLRVLLIISFYLKCLYPSVNNSRHTYTHNSVLEKVSPLIYIENPA